MANYMQSDCVWHFQVSRHDSPLCLRRPTTIPVGCHTYWYYNPYKFINIKNYSYLYYKYAIRIGLIEEIENMCQHGRVLATRCANGNHFARLEQFSIDNRIVYFLFEYVKKAFLAKCIARLGSLKNGFVRDASLACWRHFLPVYRFISIQASENLF